MKILVTHNYYQQPGGEDQVFAAETTLLEGPTIKEVFEAYIEHFLAPTLRVGRVVVMDNLSAHKGERVGKLIEDRECEGVNCSTCRPIRLI